MLCDICGAPSMRRRRVLTFHLEYRPPGKPGRGRKAGEIRLCQRCWSNLRNPLRHIGGDE